MYRIFTSRLLAVFVTLCVFFSPAPVIAQTYSTTQIIVSGQAFVIGLEDANFNTANDRHGGNFLTGQPWWNVNLDTAFNSTTGTVGARTFQNALAAQETLFNTMLTELGFTGDNQQYTLAMIDGTTPASQVDIRRIRVTTFGSGPYSYSGLSDFGKTSGTSDGFNVVYMSAQAVPEINGPVMAQVSFVLLGCLMFLRTRRRGAEVRLA